MPAPPRFLMSIHNDYPDDDSDKMVILHAHGFQRLSSDRHVLLQWSNGMQDNGSDITQIVQLTGQPGNYNYYAPVVKLRGLDSYDANQIFKVGTFSHAQRSQILHLASRVEFQRTSTVNDCMVWLRDLLVAMVDGKLITQTKFDEIIEAVPLPMRQPEQ